MADPARLEDLKRRVERDPASIAFAQLAEEYRRLGQFEEAARVVSRGLILHPEYLSARVTRARAFTELGRFDEAHADLAFVLRVAPDHASAARAAEELLERRRVAQDGGVLGELEAWLAAIVADREHRLKRS